MSCSRESGPGALTIKKPLLIVGTGFARGSLAIFQKISDNGVLEKIIGDTREEMVSENIKENEQPQEESRITENVAGENAAETGDGETAEVRDVEMELSSALEEVASLKDRMLRLAADSENFKKRMERDRTAALKYAGEQIFREILPVVDNLERAVGLSAADTAASGNGFSALLEGVQLTLKSLLNTLEKFEVKPIESVGLPFDPNKQEALTMEPSETVPASHVITEFEKGYYYKDRLLRPARVVVSSGKPAAQQ